MIDSRIWPNLISVVHKSRSSGDSRKALYQVQCLLRLEDRPFPRCFLKGPFDLRRLQQVYFRRQLYEDIDIAVGLGPPRCIRTEQIGRFNRRLGDACDHSFSCFRFQSHRHPLGMDGSSQSVCIYRQLYSGLQELFPFFKQNVKSSCLNHQIKSSSSILPLSFSMAAWSILTS